MFCGLGKKKEDSGYKLPDWSLTITKDDINGRIDNRVEDEMTESK